MYIQVELSGQPVVRLMDADNFRAFAVVLVDGQGEGDLRGALDGLGVLDASGEHVFLEPEAVKDLAGDVAGEQWSADFDSMIGYARSKGWVDDAGRVRAHIERRTDDPAG